MLDHDEIDLIATSEDGADTRKAPIMEDHGDVVEIPIKQRGNYEVWVVSGLVAGVSTPVFYLFLSSWPHRIPVIIQVYFLIGWLVVVSGPLIEYYLIPFGKLKSDHLLRFNRKTKTFSYLGGNQCWELDQIRYLLAVSGIRWPGWSYYTTELQIIVGKTKPFQKHLLLVSSKRDPEVAYGELIRTFASAMQVPAYIAKISKDGSKEVVQVSDNVDDGSYV